MAGLDENFDTPALRSYLSAALGEQVTDFEVLADGLNLNVAVSTADGENGYVLRVPRKLRETTYMLPVEAEYRVMEGLVGTAVPAPDPVLFCAGESVLGDSFFLMERLDGEPVPLGSDLPHQFRNPQARARFGEGVVDTLAAVHTADPAPFADACETWTAREQVEDAVERIDEAAAATGHEVPSLRRAGEWLLANAPTDNEVRLVHGDFRPGNLLFVGDEMPTVAGVLDWEAALLGDPLTELAYLLLRWRDDGDPTPSLEGIRDRHGEDCPDALAELERRNESGLAPYTNAPGSPTRREVVDRYEHTTGLSFEHEDFYRAHAAVTLGSVWADLHRRAVEAGESSDWLPHIEYVGLLAERIVDSEFPL
jgi:aminoglycoside phosphotransferase (APT) family kinase protein